jgi:hypothetical protein
MSLVAHRFGNFEYRIFVLIFSSAPAWRKQQQILEIRHVRINELPRTSYLEVKFLLPFATNSRKFQMSSQEVPEYEMCYLNKHFMARVPLQILPKEIQIIYYLNFLNVTHSLADQFFLLVHCWIWWRVWTATHKRSPRQSTFLKRNIHKWRPILRYLGMLVNKSL